MYKLPRHFKNGMAINQSREGETIEQSISRAMLNKQPLEGDAPMIYNERSAGVMASTNIRTDRFEIAIEATEKIAKSYQARRENKPKAKEGEPQSVQGKTETVTDKQ